MPRACFPAIPYCIDLIEGAYIEANDEVIKVFSALRKNVKIY